MLHIESFQYVEHVCKVMELGLLVEQTTIETHSVHATSIKLSKSDANILQSSVCFN